MLGGERTCNPFVDVILLQIARRHVDRNRSRATDETLEAMGDSARRWPWSRSWSSTTFKNKETYDPWALLRSAYRHGGDAASSRICRRMLMPGLIDGHMHP